MLKHFSKTGFFFCCLQKQFFFLRRNLLSLVVRFYPDGETKGEVLVKMLLLAPKSLLIPFGFLGAILNASVGFYVPASASGGRKHLPCT